MTYKKINVKMSVFTTWRYTGAADTELHSFLTSPLDGGKQSNFIL